MMPTQTMPLQVIEGGESWHVVDSRGALLTTRPTRGEADAFLAGYRVAREDAQAQVREAAERLGRLARS